MAPDPGTYIARTIAGWPLLVIRGQDGALKGFHNVCRHRASMIVEDGIGKTAALRCMYHSWVYDMDGQLKMARDFVRMMPRFAAGPSFFDTSGNMEWIDFRVSCG
ncbi:MAG: Rieske 2Fe-2S domain-containing protein [Rhodospirillales bacterium]|nr:Rieske 2Fe-2S domain-containing protein [Rhodospirillales bacterium]